MGLLDHSSGLLSVIEWPVAPHQRIAPVLVSCGGCRTRVQTTSLLCDGKGFIFESALALSICVCYCGSCMWEGFVVVVVVVVVVLCGVVGGTLMRGL